MRHKRNMCISLVIEKVHYKPLVGDRRYMIVEMARNPNSEPVYWSQLKWDRKTINFKLKINIYCQSLLTLRQSWQYWFHIALNWDKWAKSNYFWLIITDYSASRWRLITDFKSCMIMNTLKLDLLSSWSSEDFFKCSLKWSFNSLLTLMSWNIRCNLDVYSNPHACWKLKCNFVQNIKSENLCYTSKTLHYSSNKPYLNQDICYVYIILDFFGIDLVSI